VPIRRIGLAVLLVVGLTLAPVVVEAQQAGARPPRVGYLSGGSESPRESVGVRLQFVWTRTAADIEKAFVDMTKAHAGALAVLSTPMFGTERKRLVDLAAKNRLPTVYSFRSYVLAGGLMSYGPNLADMSRRAATYVDKILRGTKPADLPVEQPTTFELVINLKTALALDLTIPQPVLLRADQVIQ
jgi:putative ABC transport system substrate-binding protein